MMRHDVITGFGCKGCPDGAEFDCFVTLKSTEDFSLYPELVEFCLDNDVPVWQRGKASDEMSYLNNIFQNGDLATSDEVLSPSCAQADHCPNQPFVREAVRTLGLFGYQSLESEE
jgi:hypothetical protein